MSDVAAFPAERDRERTLPLPPLMPLSVRDLSLRIDGSVILDRISLDLGRTGCTVIMGANGAGKSFFLRVLNGLVEPSGGTVDWNAAPLGASMRRQALVFQKPVLLRRSVAANVEFVLKNRGRDRAELGALLEKVGLAHKARQPARLLSGGEAQRLALARALATEPEVLLLDEPTASLDPASIAAIETIVNETKAEGTRIIFVTHDIGQARRIADDVVFLHHGRVCEHTSAIDFFETPKTRTAQDYLAGKLPM